MRKIFAIIECVNRKSTKIYKARYKNVDFYWVKASLRRPEWKKIKRKTGGCPVVLTDDISTPLPRVCTRDFFREVGFIALKKMVADSHKPKRLKRICIEDTDGDFSEKVIPLLSFAGEVLVVCQNHEKYRDKRDFSMSEYGSEVVLTKRIDTGCDAFFSCDSLKLYSNFSPCKYSCKIKIPEDISLPSGTSYYFAAAMFSAGMGLFVEEVFTQTVELPIESLDLSF